MYIVHMTEISPYRLYIPYIYRVSQKKIRYPASSNVPAKKLIGRYTINKGHSVKKKCR